MTLSSHILLTIELRGLGLIFLESKVLLGCSSHILTGAETHRRNVSIIADPRVKL